MEIFCKSVSSQRQKPESYRIHIYGLRASVECERLSEHSTHRDESHIYGVYSILGFVYLSSIQRITESLSPDATSLLRTLRSYGQMRTYLRMLSGALLFLPSVLHRGKQHRFCYELLCKNRSLTV